MEAEMRRVHVLVVAGLLTASLDAVAQDTLPSGDVQVFSGFHARLLEVSELGAWGARRLSDDKARKLAEWMSGYTGKFAKSIEEFLGKHKASSESIADDSLVVAARQLRQDLEPLSRQALDSAWALGVNGWLDRARVQAIFIDSKRLHHKKARGRESSLRWAWGEPYSRTCVLRERFEKEKLACGAPPVEPPSHGS
jgi:hypothetical protein